MDVFQIEMFSSLKSYGFAEGQCSYVHDILKELKYKFDEGLNTKQINSLFEHKKDKFIKSILDKMNGKLIMYNPKKSRGREKRYFITKAGIELIDKYYDI